MNAQQLTLIQAVQAESFANARMAYRLTCADPRRIMEALVLLQLHARAVIVYQDSAANAQQPVARLRVQVENSVSVSKYITPMFI